MISPSIYFVFRSACWKRKSIHLKVKLSTAKSVVPSNWTKFLNLRMINGFQLKKNQPWSGITRSASVGVKPSTKRFFITLIAKSPFLLFFAVNSIKTLQAKNLDDENAKYLEQIRELNQKCRAIEKEKFDEGKSHSFSGTKTVLECKFSRV